MESTSIKASVKESSYRVAWLALSGAGALAFSTLGVAQVSDRGLSPAANTYRSYQDASVVRDSGLNQPLDLLNDFYPAIEVTIADHDNVRRRPGFEEDDLKIEVKPSLAYRTNIGRHQFYASYSGRFTFHNEFDREDSDANDVSAKIGLDIARSWDIDVFASAGNTFENRGVSGSRPFVIGVQGNTDEGPDRIDYRRYGADLIYGRKLNHLTAVLGFEHSDTGFKADDGGGFIPAGNRDRESDSIHFDLNYRIGARTSVFGRIEQTEVDYDRSVRSLDSEQTDFLVGLRWKPTSRISGVVGVGRTERDFDDDNLEGYEGSNYYANVDFALSPFSKIQFAASRAIEEPSDLEASFFDSELLGVSWDLSITPHLIFNAYSKWIDDDYNTDREDQFYDWGIGFDYAWRPWLSAGLYYGEIERESTRQGVAFEDSYFGIRLRSDLRSLLKQRSSSSVEPSSFPAPQKTAASQ